MTNDTRQIKRLLVCAERDLTAALQLLLAQGTKDASDLANGLGIARNTLKTIKGSIK